MFLHNFKYSLKILFKNKMLIFWTFAFPLILGTFFYMAFSNIENSEKLDIIDIAIVENEAWQNNEIFQKAFEALSEEGEDQLFQSTYTTKEEAEKLLKDNQIIGYVYLEDKPTVVVNQSGINETILKRVTEEIQANEDILKTLITEKMNEYALTNSPSFDQIGLYKEIQSLLEEPQYRIKDRSKEQLSYTMIEYYTLIAMTCLYGGILAMSVMNQNLANMSHKGKRISSSSAPKKTILLSSLLASYVTQLIGVAILFVYTIVVLKVNYGTNFFFILLLAIVGSLAGLSLGLAITTISKASENTKTGIILAVTMFGCFLSGMMGITMKYIVDKYVPFLNKINPASMITDGFYALYYYDTYDRYFFNIMSLGIFSVLMIACSYRILRRQKYDSI